MDETKAMHESRQNHSAKMSRHSLFSGHHESVERDVGELTRLALNALPLYAKMLSDDECDIADHSVGYRCDGEQRLELLSRLNEVGARD